MKIDIKKTLSNNGTRIYEIIFEGAFDLAAYQKAGDDLVKEIGTLAGKPFRVIIDFLKAKIMDDKECDIFVQTQNQACHAGMERDAFVTTSAVLKAQFERLAATGVRRDKLGNINFFNTLDEARAFIMK